MRLRRIRYEDDDESFRIEGGGRVGIGRKGSLVLPLDIAGEVGVAWLAKALKRAHDYYGAYLEAIFLTDTPAAELDTDTINGEVYVEYDDGVIAVQAGTPVSAHSAPSSPDLARVFGPLLARHRATWRDSWRSDEDFPSLHISATLRGGGHSLADLYRLGVDLQELLSALERQMELTAHAARNLVAGGQLKLLLGQRESSWLEAKGAPPRIASDANKWELAKDVVAFANGGGDALLLYGVVSRKDANGDVLGSARPFALGGMDVAAMRATLRERIVPLIPDLNVGVVEARDGYGYGWIYVPAQAQELRPFMVAGTLSGESYLGTHVSVPFRAGEDTAYLDASAVHSLLAAGRAALQAR
jgi:hypothetical protein